jgi:hypothetical protein
MRKTGVSKIQPTSLAFLQCSASGCQSARKHIRPAPTRRPERKQRRSSPALSASTRAIVMSRRELLRRITQSCSGRPSRTDMTKTKHSNGSSTRIAATGLFYAPDDRKPGTILDTIVSAKRLQWNPKNTARSPVREFVDRAPHT